jgi:hypothetical protein
MRRHALIVRAQQDRGDDLHGQIIDLHNERRMSFASVDELWTVLMHFIDNPTNTTQPRHNSQASTLRITRDAGPPQDQEP